MTPRSRGPINLTAVAERTWWPERRRVARVLARANRLELEIRALDGTEEERRSPSLCDDVYVVLLGYGLLRRGQETVERTAGDVVLAPGGVAHGFERLDGELKVWRISLHRATGP